MRTVETAGGPRVRAPELTGRGWLNTGGRRLTLDDLRGCVVIVDFWTFCCINCLHVLDELRPLEEEYADVLLVVGVHSPKFAHERDPRAVADAVARSGVDHPVLDDPDLTTWRAYTARAWPTLAVIDPEGYLVATMAGEGHRESLRRLVAELVATHEAKGTLRRGRPAAILSPDTAAAPADTAPPPAAPAEPGTLSFPGKVVRLPHGRLLVSDSAHHRLVETEPDGVTVRRVIGAGRRGRADGAATAAEFNEPQGLCLLPPEVARRVGYDLVVADTVNHLLRGVRLPGPDDPTEIEVSTVAGTGRQWRGEVDVEPHDARTVDLSSPWDLAWYDGRVIVAMAGIHQLWWFDPVAGTAGVWAGTTVEGLRDGPLQQAWFAQPSGLATDGRRLWIADSETSALRWVEDGILHTAVGHGLFDFGNADGDRDTARMQHPLGVAALPDGTVLVADTYNGALRRYDPRRGVLTTVATGLAEPSDVLVETDGATGGAPDTVLVVESAAHRLTRVPLGGADAPGVRLRTERPATVLAPGEVTLEVVFTPGPGQKLDDSFGPPTRLEVTASPPGLLREGGGETTNLTRRLVLDGAVTSGVLQVVAQAATCDAEGEHPACHLTRQDWGVPVVVGPSGADRLSLVLRGMA